MSHFPIRSLSVRAAFFGEGGWAEQVETWNPDEGESLGSFIARVARVPADEAERIGEETLDEWRRRGGDESSGLREVGLMVFIFSMFGLAALGAAAVVAGLVVLVWRLFFA